MIDRAIQTHGGAGVTDVTPLAAMAGWHRAMRLFDGPTRCTCARWPRANWAASPWSRSPRGGLTPDAARLAVVLRHASPGSTASPVTVCRFGTDRCGSSAGGRIVDGMDADVVVIGGGPAG